MYQTTNNLAQDEMKNVCRGYHRHYS
jgi:hypothetical protein